MSGYFSPSNPNKCEGYWSKDYKPIVSKFIWAEKDLWIAKALYISSITPSISYRGLAFSRIDGTIVGNKEYYDAEYDICWPEGYIEHYIKDNNIMPTKRFYDYINMKYSLLM